MTEFNLSEKRKEVIDYFNKHYSNLSPDKRDTIIEVLAIIEQQDKEFIQREEDLIRLLVAQRISIIEFWKRRKKLAGKNLIDNSFQKHQNKKMITSGLDEDTPEGMFSINSKPSGSNSIPCTLCRGTCCHDADGTFNPHKTGTKTSKGCVNRDKIYYGGGWNWRYCNCKCNVCKDFKCKSCQEGK